MLPVEVRRWLRAQLQKYELRRRPVGKVRFGSLGQVSPISSIFGFDRGLPVDRYYIEKFLSAQSADIYGRVLEIGDDRYTRKFGGDRVAGSSL
jgi:hypothetical protein